MINLYKQLVRGEEVNGDTTASAVPGEEEAVAWGGHRALCVHVCVWSVTTCDCMSSRVCVCVCLPERGLSQAERENRGGGLASCVRVGYKPQCPAPGTCWSFLAHPGSTSALLDLSGLDLPTGTTHPAVPSCPGGQASPESLSTSVSLLDDELMSLGKEGPGQEGQAKLWQGHGNLALGPLG